MHRLLPPERPDLCSRVNIHLNVAKLWILSLMLILVAFIAGLLSNWGLLLAIGCSLGLAFCVVWGLTACQKRQVTKKLDSYEQGYRLYAQKRRR